MVIGRCHNGGGCLLQHCNATPLIPSGVRTQHATKKENRPGDNPLSDSWDGKVVLGMPAFVQAESLRQWGRLSLPSSTMGTSSTKASFFQRLMMLR